MIRRTPYGRFGDREVDRFDVETPGGLKASFISFGARLTHLFVPDRKGRLDDVVLGFDDLRGYIERDACFGATCGRVGNRIHDARYEIDGEIYELDRNHGPHHIHGGREGFDRQIWENEIDPYTDRIRFTLTSPDGHMGHPGKVEAVVTYRLNDPGVLSVDMMAQTDRACVMNMLHHSYFNLSGGAQTTILDHRLTVAANTYLPSGEDTIPTGEFADVAGTPLDFTSPKRIRADIADLVEGYDHNFCLRERSAEPRLAAELEEPMSGRRLRVETTEPGLQVYTAGHFPASTLGKGGVDYPPYAGIALESQNYPNAINQPGFPSSLLRPGQTYHHALRLTFSAD